MADEKKRFDPEKLRQGYEKMLHEMKVKLGELKEQQGPKLQRGLQDVKAKMIEMGEVSEEEAHKIGEYIQRDLHDMGTFLVETKKALGDWFYFDCQLIEDKLWPLLQEVADQTALEWYEFRQKFKLDSETFRTGEVTGPGSLQCSNCGKEIHFHKVSHIPPCAGCQETEFSRIGDGEED